MGLDKSGGLLGYTIFYADGVADPLSALAAKADMCGALTHVR
jgi:hypothetical protein